MLLVGEVLHRLEIEQAVDCLGVGVGVAFIHRPPHCNPPICRRGGKAHVHNDHYRHCHRIAPIELDEEDPQDQEKFDNCWDRGQHGAAHNCFDRIAPPLKDPRKPAGLALEMKAQRQRVQMGKNVACEAAHRTECKQMLTARTTRKQAQADAARVARSRRQDRAARQRPTIFAVSDGRTTVGSVEQLAGGGFVARDRRGGIIGTYASAVEASRAIPVSS